MKESLDGLSNAAGGFEPPAGWTPATDPRGTHVTAPDDHERFEELAVGHALSALEPEDEQVFREHLAACTRCQRDVAGARRRRSRCWPMSADPVEPPRVGARGHPRRHAAGPAAQAARRRAVARPRRQPDRVQPASARRAASAPRPGRAARAGRWVGAAAAAAALVLSLGAWNLVLRSDRDAARQYGDRLAAAVRDLAEPGQQERRPAPARTAASWPSPSCRTATSASCVDGLAAERQRTSYVLWAQDASGAVRPVGAFDVDAGAGRRASPDLPVEAGVDAVTALPGVAGAGRRGAGARPPGRCSRAARPDARRGHRAALRADRCAPRPCRATTRAGARPPSSPTGWRAALRRTPGGALLLQVLVLRRSAWPSCCWVWRWSSRPGRSRSRRSCSGCGSGRPSSPGPTASSNGPRPAPAVAWEDARRRPRASRRS